MNKTTEVQVEKDQIAEMETAVAHARAQTNPVALIEALIALGQAYLDGGNVPKALTQFEEALALAQAENEALLEARLWGYKGICLLRLGNTHFAQIALYKSYGMAKSLNHAPLMVDALTQLGMLQLDANEPTKAISKLEQAFGLALAHHDSLRAMNLAGKLGGVFQGLSALEKAMEYYRHALQLAQELERPQVACATRLQIGHTYLANKEVDMAQEQFEKALELAGDLADPRAELSALQSLMRAHIAADSQRLAMLYADHALAMAREVDDNATEINVLGALTVYLLEQAQFKKALPYLQRGLALARASGDWEWQLTMADQLGFAQYSLEQLPEAQQNTEYALDVAMQLQSPLIAAQLYGRLGAILAEQGHTAEAIQAAEQALKLAQEQGDALLVGEQQVLLAFAYADLDEPQRAIGLCRQAIAAFHDSDDDGTMLARAEALLAELGQWSVTLA